MRALGAREHELAFWLRHVRIGVSISQLTLLVSLVYAARFAQPENRTPLTVLIGVAFVATLGVNLLPLRRILAGRWAIPFFAAWSALLSVLIVGGVLIDGAGDTPVSWLFFLPVVYGAIAYPPVGVMALGVPVVVTAVLVRIFTGGSGPAALMMGSTLALVTTMCAVSARNHWRTTRSQSALADRLAHLALFDGLTGVLNHHAFHERFTQEVARSLRYKRPLALLMVDLDGFKEINDTHGHPRGDAVLAAVGASLQEATRDTDVVGRVGGDEFAVLLPETAPDEAARLAERIRVAVGALHEPMAVTASVGVSAMPHPAHDGATLMAFADQAVYRAKRSGRDYVSIYGSQPQAREDGSDDMVLHERVRELLNGERLTTVFQPVISLLDGTIVGYEALSRIEGSSLGPSAWLDLAEQVGMREALEAAMWRRALTYGPPPEGTVLFLNAGPEALLSGALDEFRTALPAKTAIEVSEHHAITDYTVLTRDLTDWVELGVRIAVDDMGAGHANLAHVLNLAPHYVKLDRSLVNDLDLHPHRQALLEALLMFSARIDSSIIAEGVETAAEAEALLKAGVHFAQGHLFGRPAPPWAQVQWSPNPEHLAATLAEGVSPGNAPR